MTSPRREWGQISLLLYVRGFGLVALAAIALRWPEESLFTMMAATGVIVVALGTFELVVAMISPARISTRLLIALDALLSIAFGAIAISARLASPRTALDAVAIWLLLHSVFALAVASRIADARHGRGMLMAWSAGDVICALVILADAGLTHLGLLYLGASYTVVYGASQVAAALWMRRALATLVSQRPADPMQAKR